MVWAIMGVILRPDGQALRAAASAMTIRVGLAYWPPPGFD
jgi:hypothetical protein